MAGEQKSKQKKSPAIVFKPCGSTEVMIIVVAQVF